MKTQIEIKQFIVGNLNNRCYLIIKNNKAVLIDAGECFNEVLSYVNENNIKLCGVILTHGHFDHACTAKKFQELNIPIYIHKNDADKLYTDNNLGKQFDCKFENLYADYLIEEGSLKIDDFDFYILHTPGHSKGGISIVIENHIFVGDTIFENGYGRVDLYDGDFTELKESIRKLKKYKNEKYLFYYGH